jgi:hypothetical protein
VPRPETGAVLLAEEERRLLAEAMGELPDETREVVALFYSEGRSVRQVADLLGMREDAVKQRLARARARLREAMMERLGRTLQRTAPGAAFTAAVLLDCRLPHRADRSRHRIAPVDPLRGGPTSSGALADLTRERFSANP